MISWLEHPDDFPPTHAALIEPNGLLAAGGALTPAWLLAAYRRGIFPWFSDDDPAILWWSPDPRLVLFPPEMRIHRSLRKILQKGIFELRFDSAFNAVIEACAAPRDGQPGTWITTEMRTAYQEMHRLGHAHSIECWQNDVLVGGLYGIALGQVFFGESMFSHVSNASKVALAGLCHWLEQQNFAVIDCQMTTSHLLSLGAREISRHDFCTLLTHHIPANPEGRVWQHACSTTDLFAGRPSEPPQY